MLNKKEVETQNLALLRKGTRLSAKRNSLRSVYNNDPGKEQLMRLISTGKVFGRISEDPGEIAIHNLVIGILEECGFLDETNLINIVNNFFSLPLISREIEK